MRHQQSLSPKDWQLLSEYMDGQLSPRDQARLEQRLKEREDLRAVLDELRRTRAVLRSVKLKRVPRNFTLTPAMLPQPRSNPFAQLIPVLNFTSAISALALVLVLIVGLLPGLSAGSSMRAAPKAPTFATESDAQQSAAAGTEAPMIIVWSSPYGLGGGGGGGAGGASITMEDSRGAMTSPEAGAAEPPAAAEPGIESPAGPEATPAPETMLQTVPADPAAGAAQAAPTAQAESPAAPAPATKAPAEPESVSQAPLKGAGPILGVRPAEEAEANNQAALNTLREENRAIRSAPSFPWIIPAVLALMAVGSLLTVRILRRKYSA